MERTGRGEGSRNEKKNARRDIKEQMQGREATRWNMGERERELKRWIKAKERGKKLRSKYEGEGNKGGE